ncbi:DNA replication/repair protein RecF [Photobacterium leiognathi subsp. mandapamensis]|uniref:DNA replication/repair protein RecF n=1 Tax=Photobacterium leiognathi TaxID=553611 RepID=UPI000D15F8B5|nr:DNA replication/repair protein RecF [Photobacterium leiognathi]PSW61203.1 DNA replication/repair protein RecF [Photobacterium leiognathi subsp. mandapamensis]
MALTRLMVHDFRNIESCDLALATGFNFLVGANGSGKTSVLEAIHYLGHGRSFRSHLTSRVIRHEQSELFIHGRVVDNQTQLMLPIGLNKKRDGTTEVKIAGEPNQKVAQLAQILPLQLITPEGFDLLIGGPKYRRAFIDWGVFHVEPKFYHAWSRLKRLTKQRNALLKTARSYRELSYWDQELALLAEQISVWRQDYISAVKEKAAEIFQVFLPEYEIQLGYYRGWEKETPYAELLKRNFERDCQLGYTASGPHKADLRIKVAGTPVEDVLSRGQLKLMVCALRLAQGLHLTEATGKQCIYLIDDFASELDSHRRTLLAQRLKETNAQVFISAISDDQVADMLDENGKLFHVEHGKITAG